tara:strand:+ start:4841 stop:5050 length:210 start_codon:yes stop_codon:yes gene_type:complete
LLVDASRLLDKLRDARPAEKETTGDGIRAAMGPPQLRSAPAWCHTTDDMNLIDTLPCVSVIETFLQAPE